MQKYTVKKDMRLGEFWGNGIVASSIDVWLKEGQEIQGNISKRRVNDANEEQLEYIYPDTLSPYKKIFFIPLSNLQVKAFDYEIPRKCEFKCCETNGLVPHIPNKIICFIGTNALPVGIVLLLLSFLIIFKISK